MHCVHHAHGATTRTAQGGAVREILNARLGKGDVWAQRLLRQLGGRSDQLGVGAVLVQTGAVALESARTRLHWMRSDRPRARLVAASFVVCAPHATPDPRTTAMHGSRGVSWRAGTNRVDSPIDHAKPRPRTVLGAYNSTTPRFSARPAFPSLVGLGEADLTAVH